MSINRRFVASPRYGKTPPTEPLLSAFAAAVRSLTRCVLLPEFTALN